MGWLLEMVPGWVVVLGVMLAWVAFGLAILAIVHRRVPADRLEPHNDVSGFVFAVIGAVYAILLAFVVVGVWERYDDVRRGAEVEAAHVITLYRAAGLVEGGSDLQPPIRRYAETVVRDDWPAMAHGGLSTASDEALYAVAQAAAKVPAIGEGNGWGDLFIGDLHDLRAARDERDAASGGALPGVLWLVIVLGGLITVGYSAVYGTRDRLLHRLVTAALAAVVGLSIGVVVVLDSPYRGDSAVSPLPFVHSIELMGPSGG
jgi:hypothetical protein